MRTTIFLFAAALAAAPCSAATITVDFETVAVDGELQVQPGGVFQGMRFVDDRPLGEMHLIDDGGCFVGCAASGSTSLLYEGIHNNGQPALVVRQAAGLPFRLLSFDAGEAFPIIEPVDLTNAKGIGLRGHLAAGGIIEAFVNLDGVADGNGGVADFQAITLESTLFDQPMAAVAFWGLYTPGVFPGGGNPSFCAGFSLDNMLFDVDGSHLDYTALNVPEPSAFALVAFATSCLLLLRYHSNPQ